MEIQLLLKTNKQTYSKTLYKENIENLYEWCINNKNFIINNIKNTGEKLEAFEFNFSAIAARYFYRFGPYYNSFSRLMINFVDLTKEQIEIYFNQDAIDYCEKLKKKITASKIKDYFKYLVDNYGFQLPYNENEFSLSIKNNFDLNSDGLNAFIGGIRKIDNSYYLSFY